MMKICISVSGFEFGRRSFLCFLFPTTPSHKSGRVYHRILPTGGDDGGTKIAKNCMEMKELGIFWVADREDWGADPPKFLGEDTADRGDSPPIPPVGKTLF